MPTSNENLITLNVSNPEKAITMLLERISQQRGVIIHEIEANWIDVSTVERPKSTLQFIRLISTYSQGAS